MLVTLSVVMYCTCTFIKNIQDLGESVQNVKLFSSWGFTYMYLHVNVQYMYNSVTVPKNLTFLSTERCVRTIIERLFYVQTLDEIMKHVILLENQTNSILMLVQEEVHVHVAYNVRCLNNHETVTCNLRDTVKRTCSYKRQTVSHSTVTLAKEQ